MITLDVESDFEEKYPLFMEAAVRASGLLLTEFGKWTRREIALSTPIRTGRASASWNVSTNTPDLTQRDENYNDPEGAPYAGRVTLDNVGPEDAIIISNSVSYIDLLNSGSSTKAPAGFVEASAMRAVDPANVEKIVRAVRARLQSSGLGG